MIEVRGDNVFKGYWNMPTETANALRTGPDGEPISTSLVPDEVVSERLRPLSGEEGEIEDRTLQRGLVLLAEEEEATEEVA